MFNTTRGLLKFFLLNLITFCIYGLVVLSHVSEEINFTATKRDGLHTMHFLLMFFIVGPLTLGIGAMIWWHRICNRIGDEARARGCSTDFGAADFWLWKVLGLLIIIGPFIFFHRLFVCTNAINDNYLTNGRN